MKEQLEERLKEIMTALEQSVANHNGLLGRKLELEHMITLAPEEPEIQVAVAE